VGATWDSVTAVMRAALIAVASAFAAAPCASAAGASATPLFGVTVDRVAKVSRISEALVALPERPTTRVYFEPHQKASQYAPALAQIDRVSAVMGELLDSSDEKSLSVEAFQTHAQEYVSALSGSVDIWEVGNEAYRDVSSAGGTTALTLYENSFGPEHCGDGESEPTPTQFTQRWVPAEVADGLDYVLLSYYPTQCGGRMPADAEVRSELERLHALYPNAQLGFGEIGLPRHASKRTAAQAEAIMRWAYSLDPALPYYVGGYFWWYGWEDALKPRARLDAALAEAFSAEAAALKA
jgi:hypothetical protein